MNESGLLQPFRKKLLKESVLRALLSALLLGAVSLFCLSLLYHILLRELPALLSAGVGGTVFLLSFILRLVLLFPSEKKLAARMDELGLEERVSTMIALRDETTGIAAVQRKDAVRHIEKTDPGQMKFRLRKREWIFCLVWLCLAAAMLLLPPDAFALGTGEEKMNQEQQQAIREFIQALRDEIREAALEDGLKEEVSGIIDELEEKLGKSDSELEQAAEIDQAKRKIDALLKAALTKDKIGEALQKYGLTRKLGEAVSAGDTAQTAEELGALETALKTELTQISELCEDIEMALDASGVEPSDDLYAAFSAFAEALSEAEAGSSGIEAKLGDIFDTAEEAIIAALLKQNAVSEEKEKIDESLSDAKDEVLGKEKGGEEESPEGEAPEGEAPDGEAPDGEAPEGEAPEGEAPDGEIPEGGFGQGGEGSDFSSMTEGIYDPVSGNVTYGEVFAAYYAEYLAALEAGEVPEELQEIIDSYFTSLN